MELSKKQGNILLTIAREKINNVLNDKSDFDMQNYQSEKWLFDYGAVFVTLTIDDQLRGCIGSLAAYRPLINDLLEHAQNAAFNDTRFYPLNKAEFALVSIEVSVLSPRKEVTYQTAEDLKRIIRSGIDGVYLTLGRHGATFLPQVWEQLPDFNDFFSHLSVKAGLKADAIFREHPKIEIYQVQKFEEEE